jgi:hypothetical protein
MRVIIPFAAPGESVSSALYTPGRRAPRNDGPKRKGRCTVSTGAVIGIVTRGGRDGHDPIATRAAQGTPFTSAIGRWDNPVLA